jgi:hypothetical protein
MRAALGLIVAGALTALMIINIAGVGPWAGAVLFSVSGTHGIHQGDLPVIMFWVIGVAGIVTLSLWRD